MKRRPNQAPNDPPVTDSDPRDPGYNLDCTGGDFVAAGAVRLLLLAAETIGARGRAGRGDVVELHQRLARMWSTGLSRDPPLTADDVLAMLADVKRARAEQSGDFMGDNGVDWIAYNALAWVVEGERKKNRSAAIAGSATFPATPRGR